MLWSVCDTFADATVHASGVETGKSDLSSATSGAVAKATVVGKGVDDGEEEARPSLRSMWPAMLFELQSLAVDFRPEVRSDYPMISARIMK